MTPKQEAFAHAYVETGSAAEAYRRAYSCKPTTKAQTIASNANALLANTHIALRIQQLRAETAKRNAITRDDIVRMILEDREMAKTAGDASVSNTITMNLAKFIGEYVETKNVKASTVNHNIEERVSPTSEWIEGMLGSPAKAPPSNARPN